MVVRPNSRSCDIGLRDDARALPDETDELILLRSMGTPSVLEGSQPMPMKDRIDVHCPACGKVTSLPWPTSHKRGAQEQCQRCSAHFPIAVAVERAILGDAPDRALRFVVSTRDDHP
jgi:predicted RNA-binding Zn-ribbon protein involved in translation (DUF1610 family)